MNYLRWIAVSLVLVAQASAIELVRLQVKDHPKALGQTFSILRPKTWAERPERANPAVITALWSTPQGAGDSMTLVIPANQNPKLRAVTKADYKKAFDSWKMEQAIGASMPFADVNFLGKKLLENHKFPAGYLDYEAKALTPSGGMQAMRMRVYVVYLGSVMLQVQFNFMHNGNENRLEAFAPDMAKIIESLEWKK